MRVIDLGVTDFLEAYRFQRKLVDEVSGGFSEDTLLITEHNPVITIGRKGLSKNILRSEGFLASRGIKVFNTDRGGDVTYHGYGQIVGYPIFRLKNGAKDIHYFLRFLEEIGNRFLIQYSIKGELKEGFRGIWVEGKKIGSIGIGVKKWVSYHGIAINVNTDLVPFSFIRPCGIEGVEMTSLKNIFCRELDIDDAKQRLKTAFQEVSWLANTAYKN